MLALPLKRGETTNFSTTLEPFLQKEYASSVDFSGSSPATTARYQQDLAMFQQYRNAAITTTLASDQIGIQHLLHYHYHLKSLSKRLSSYESEIKFSLTWSEAFRPNNRITSGSLYSDWGAVLWNLAALESHKGSLIDRSTDEGIRSASIQFQNASGIVEFIRTVITPKILGPKAAEIQDLFLHMISQLLLAQAQICFYEKAIRDRKTTGTFKPGLIAKLAQQVATFYSAAVDMCREREVSSAIDISWIYHMEFQRDCFRGVSEYWQSVACKEDAVQRGVGYGEEITRLRKAESILTQTIQLGRQKGVALHTVATAESVLVSIQKAKSSAEKDNSTIYHDSIPDYQTLVPITGVAMVKTSPPPEYYTVEKPLFNDLLPKGIREIMTQYQERLRTFLHEIEAKSNRITDEGRSSLSALGLPASLEVLKSGGDLPDGLWKKIEHVQQMGGLQELQRKLEDVENLAERARNTIDGILNSMKREDNLDRSFRQRYPDYHQPASAQLNRDIQTTTQLMLQAHETGRNNDTSLAIQMNQTQFLELMKLLGSTRRELNELLPRTGKDKAFSYDTNRLEGLLLSIAEVIDLRMKTLESLKSKTPNESLVCDRMLERVTKVTGPLTEEIKMQFIQQELEVFSSDIQVLENSFSRQVELLQQVFQENIFFTNARENDPVNLERDRVLQSLEQGTSAYFAYQSQLNAGGVFYRDMQSRLTTLMQQCDDLSYTQQLQRQDYETDRMRAQDRAAQELKDHEMAMKLAAELEQSQIAAKPPVNPPPNNMNAGMSYSTLPVTQQKPPPPLNPYNVAYGQVINGPPASAISAPMQSYPYNPSAPPSSSPTSPQYQEPTITRVNPPIIPSTPPPPQSYSQSQPPPQNYSYQPHLQHQQQQQPQQQPTPQSGYYYQQPPPQQPQSYPPPPSQQSQYSNTNYPSLPGAAPQSQYQQQPQQQQQFPQSQSHGDKIQRLVEMGFERNAVINSLNANNGDEVAALNGLLSGNTSSPTSDQLPTSQPPPNQASQPSQQQQSGFFGKLWGK